MKIATWNINSIKARIPLVQEWVRIENPDVILFQEIKTQEITFPFQILEDEGYTCAVYGQKSYNGVAIASKLRLEDINKGIIGFEDEQARYIDALVDGKIRVASIYIPNGQNISSPKFIYKLDFLKALKLHLTNILKNSEHYVIGGDYNITYHDEDMFFPDKWQGDVPCTPEERALYAETFLNQGLIDVIRHQIPYGEDNASLMTWWDYRKGSYYKNDGLRIDHILITPSLLSSLENVGVDKYTREWERPSDHAPVWCKLSI